MELFDRTINRLSALAKFLAQLHKVIVSTVVNIDVADCESNELNFNKELRTTLDKGIGFAKPMRGTSPRQRRAGIKMLARRVNG